MAYSGTVRAREPCFYAGSRYNAGAVFEVVQYCLSPQDPFEPVRVIGFEHAPVQQGPLKKIPICEVLTGLHELNRRGGA